MENEEIRRKISEIIKKELEKLKEKDGNQGDNKYGVGIPNPELIGRDENIKIDFDKYGYPEEEDDKPLFEVITKEEEKKEPKHTKEDLKKIQELFDIYNKYTDLLNYFKARSIGDVISKYTE